MRRGLSDCSLHWVLSGARRAGLELRGGDSAVAFDIRPDPFDDLFNDPPKWTKRLQAWFHRLFRISRKGPIFADEIALATYRRVHQSPPDKPYESRALRHASAALEAWPYKSPPEWKGSEPLPLEEHEMTRRESLSIVARERLGDPMRWSELFELNRDRVDDPDYLPTAVKLRVPAALEGA